MSNRGDPAWVVWLSLAGLIGLFALAVAGLSYGIAHMPQRGSTEDQEIVGDPDAGEIALAMREHFPDEYDRLKFDILNARRAGGSEEGIGQQIIQFSWLASTRRNEEAAQAPHDSLLAYRTANQQLLERLGALDPVECATYAVSGRTEYPIEDAEAKKLQAAAGAAFWKAAGAGATEPADREVSGLSDADFEAFNAALLAAGVAKGDLDLTHRMDEMTEAQQCDAGMKRMRAIGTLPPEVGDRVYGTLLAGSM